MIDIHCHILPGIDDGPDDLDAALHMARSAVAAGITTVVATPHLRSDFPRVKIDEVADRVLDLRSELTRNEIELELLPGGEVSLTWALEADDAALKRASYGQRGSDILIETPSVGGAMLPSLLGQVASRGYRVILAHPERLGDLREDPDLVNQLIDRNIRLQVNADGLLRSPRTSESAKAAREFCRSGLVTAVASDAHRGSEWRPITKLADVRPAITSLIGLTGDDQLLQRGPAAILSGEALPWVSRQPARPWRPWRRSGRS